MQNHPRPTRPETRREPVLRIVKDASLMREILERHLRREDGSVCEIANCRIGKIRLGHGYRYLVEYRLRLQKSAARKPVNLMVTGLSYPGEKTLRIWETLRASATASVGSLTPDPFVPYTYVPDLDMLVQVFPHDHRLPGLDRLLTGCPPELRPTIVAEFGSGEWQLENWTAELIKYRPVRRATVRLKVHVRDNDSDRLHERQFYAKVYPDPGEAARAYQMQDMLYQQIVADGTSFGVAKPVVHAHVLQTVVQTDVPGVSLDHLVASGQDAANALRIAARAIADLHRLKLDPHSLKGYDSPRSLHNRIARLEREAALLSAVQPALAGDIAAIVATISEGLSRVPLAPTHGDLKPEHVLIDGDAVSLIDFDFLRDSDPVLDIISMERHLAKAQANAPSPVGSTGTAERVFTEEYLAHSPPERRFRLPLYHAMSSIADAAHSQPDQQPDRGTRIENLVRQAQSRL